MDKSLHIVNVFSDRGMEGGNQLGILPDATNLTTSQMQLIAKQLNYSESTFVTGRETGSCHVRIFLPVDEIEFAGHPTVGTAYMMEKLHRNINEPRSELTIKLKGGNVGTYFTKISGNDPGKTYMDQLPVKSYGNFKDYQNLLQVLGLDKSEVITTELPIITPSTLKFVYVAVESIETIQQLDPDISRMKKLLKSTGCEPFVFTPSGMDGGDVHGRLFAPNSGIVEDPATGSAQSALLHAMKQLDLLLSKEEIVVEQGYEMGRPSKLYNRIISEEDDSLTVQTGGHVAEIVDGKITI